MTLLEIDQRAQRTARVSTATFQWDSRDSLYHMSVFEQILEDATNGIIKHEAVITLDPNSATGQYSLPSDFKAFEEITWSPAANQRAYWPIRSYTPQAFREYANELAAIPMQLPVSSPDQNGSMIVMMEYGTLNVLPKTIGGVLIMRYKPHLTPYSPNDPVWSDFAADPETAMASHSIDSTLSSAINGIVNYVVAQILLAQPDGAERFKREIGLRMRLAEQSIAPVVKASIEPVHTTPQKLRPFGGMA